VFTSNISGVALGIEAGNGELVVFIVGLLCLAASAMLLLLSVTPASVRPWLLEERERFLFFAFALVVVAVLVFLGLTIDATIRALNHHQLG
jgi:nitrate/nitrite transporter NarK